MWAKQIKVPIYFNLLHVFKRIQVSIMPNELKTELKKSVNVWNSKSPSFGVKMTPFVSFFD